MSITFTEDDLNRFTGTENYFTHPFFPDCVYSDGCAFLMKNGAAWLVEAIMSHLQANKALRTKMEENEALRNMSFWDVKLNGEGGCTLTCQEDSDKPVACNQEIEYTDLPFDMRLWVQRTHWIDNEGDVKVGWLVHLPSEY